jgi:hypothetical protein
MPSMTEPSGYALEPIREGADFTLYRGRLHGNPSTALAIAVSAKQPSPQSLRRLEHEYSLAAELDPAWAARPLALTRHEGRTILVLEDPGGEPLDQVLERDQGQPLDLTRFLRTAIGLASALGQVHRRGLIASGKFDQYKRDIPYAPLGQAFQTLSRQILVKSEAEVERRRGSLQEAVGPNGQLIVNLIPELEFISWSSTSLIVTQGKQERAFMQ